MTSERLHGILHEPALWFVLLFMLTIAACTSLAFGRPLQACVFLAAALACGFTMANRIYRLKRRLNYLISAAMNGDFSYKFPTSGIPEHQRDINHMLNRLVGHLEKLNDEARRTDEFLNLIIDLVDTGIIVSDETGRVIHSNKAALSLLSLPVITDIKRLPDNISGLAIAKTPSRLHGRNLTIHTLTDIHRPLQDTEVESWEKLTRVLTHEIMNSLTPINSIAETLGSGLPQPYTGDELRKQLSVIASSSRSLMEFVKNFRQFNILPEPDCQVLYVKPFLQKVVSLAHGFDGAAHTDITLSVFPPDAMVYTDGNMLNQVVVNIIKNALEAGASQIAIESCIMDNESVQISITNNGDVIPDEIAGQIFTPFFTTKPTGSGIGLSLSRRIIACLGGTLSLSTTHGTRFTINLC